MLESMMTMNNSRRRVIFHILSVVFVFSLNFLISCKPTVPEQYIQPDELEKILYDYYVAQALPSQGQRLDSIPYYRNLYYDVVLQKYGITKAEFDSSMVYYYANADMLYDIYVKVSKRLSNEAVSLGASVDGVDKFSQLDANGDTADIWHDATSFVLTPSPLQNKISFEIKADSAFRRGDYFLLNFFTDFIFQAGTKDAVVYVAVHYTNDSTATYVNRVGISGISQLNIPGNDDCDIKSINGFIYLNGGNDDYRTLKLMFINRIQFIRFHKSEIKDDMVSNDNDTVAHLKDSIHSSIPSNTRLKSDTVDQRVRFMRPVR